MHRSQFRKYEAKKAVPAWQARVAADVREIPASVWDSPRPGMAGALQREWEAIGAACGAFEWIALGYLAVSSALIAIFAENLAHPTRILGFRGFGACVIVAL